MSTNTKETRMTRGEASELYVALGKIEAGLTPANTVTAADNMTALHSTVAALDKGKNAWQRAVREVQRQFRGKKLGEDEGDALIDKLGADLEAKQDETVGVNLIPMKFADSEITEAKIAPATLAVIRRLLPAP